MVAWLIGTPQVVILCEDDMQMNFVRKYLMRREVDRRRIRINMAPSGRGAGSQYVIENYPVEVKALRAGLICGPVCWR